MKELRCICRRHPLLALYGTDRKTRQPFLHVKQMSKGQLSTEIVVTEGTVRIRCRECLHWHVIRIIKNAVSSKQEELPASIVL